MKTNKIIFTLLPLLLIGTACSKNNKPASSEQPAPAPSSESSSEAPASSSEEPPVPPEERERQAREELAKAIESVSGQNYHIIMTGSFSPNSEYFVSDDFYFQTVDYYYDYYEYYTYRSEGWAALEDGVMGFTRDYDTPVRPVGYVKKTASLEESKEFVNSRKKTITLNAEDWTYVSNDGDVSIFSTTNADVYAMYANLDNLSDYEGLYETMYLKIYNGMDDLRLSPKLLDNLLQYTSASIKDFGKVQELTEIASAIEKVTEWSSSSWTDISLSHITRFSEVPFPSSANKYYFIDLLGNEADRMIYQFRIGLFDTGDLTSEYASQLINEGYVRDTRSSDPNAYCRIIQNPIDGWDWDDSDNSSRRGVSLTFSYRAPTANYPQGIFYIECDSTDVPNKSGTEWSENDKSNYNVLNYVPFPNDGKKHIFYEFNGWSQTDTQIRFDDINYDEFAETYEGQLENSFYSWNEEQGMWIDMSNVVDSEYDWETYSNVNKYAAIRLEKGSDDQFIIHLLSYSVYERTSDTGFTPRECEQILYYAENLPFLSNADGRDYHFTASDVNNFQIIFVNASSNSLEDYAQTLEGYGYTKTDISGTDCYVRNLQGHEDNYGYISSEDTSMVIRLQLNDLGDDSYELVISGTIEEVPHEQLKTK